MPHRFLPLEIGALIAYILMTTAHSTAQNTTARFLLFRPSASSNAMGGVGVAMPGDAFASYYNPAALAFGGKFSFAGSYVKPIPFFGNTHWYGSLAARFRSSTIAASANIYRTGVQPMTYADDPSLRAMDEATTSWQGKVSYAYRVRNNVAVGLSASVLRLGILSDNLFGQDIKRTPTSWMADAGFIGERLFPQATFRVENGIDTSGNILMSLGSHRTNEGFSVGMALLNLGTAITFIDPAQSASPPTMVLSGVSYAPVVTPLVDCLVAIELEKQTHEPTMLNYVHLGGELTFLNLVSLRTGYCADTFGPRTSYGTFGFGFTARFFSFNVARYTRAIEPTWQFDSSLTWEW
jgi:hypothetical protein